MRVFDAAEVEATFVRFRSNQHNSSRLDGELAAEVFALLDDGINPVDVVRRTHIAPDLVERLQTQWARMWRALVLVPDARARVESALLGEAFPGPDGWNIKTAKELEAAIADAAQPTRCISCEDRPASLCQRCSKEYAARSRARE